MTPKPLTINVTIAIHDPKDYAWGRAIAEASFSYPFGTSIIPIKEEVAAAISNLREGEAVQGHLGATEVTDDATPTT